MLLVAPQQPLIQAESLLFDGLVREGEERARLTLPHALHTFLVTCLSGHLHDTDIVQEAIALNYLRAWELRGAHAAFFLSRAGEAALLLAGFYPERTKRLNVSPTYFRTMGQCAYATLATDPSVVREVERREFYGEVVDQFESLEKVLTAARTAH